MENSGLQRMLLSLMVKLIKSDQIRQGKGDGGEGESDFFCDVVTSAAYQIQNVQTKNMNMREAIYRLNI